MACLRRFGPRNLGITARLPGFGVTNFVKRGVWHGVCMGPAKRFPTILNKVFLFFLFSCWGHLRGFSALSIRFFRGLARRLARRLQYPFLNAAHRGQRERGRVHAFISVLPVVYAIGSSQRMHASGSNSVGLASPVQFAPETLGLGRYGGDTPKYSR